MHCKTYYYIQYNPDSKKASPTNAKTDMLENFINANHVLAESGFLLVPTLDDDWMWEYLQQNPEKIAAVGNMV